ncbi:Replication factor A protein 1 [Polyrhizophydium stewartii]|uniref:Replication protein A subunit n=1 Tax=Polyrhizophydium stewartii TaxID=2732419 RepID=A0ABR4N2A7_9FUNG
MSDFQQAPPAQTAQQPLVEVAPQLPPHALSAGTLRAIAAAGPESNSAAGEVTLQVLSIKKVAQNTAQAASQERFRLLLSDGINTMQAMVATQQNDHLRSGAVTKNGVIKITKYVCNSLSSKKILIIIHFDNLTPFHSGYLMVGNPSSLDENAPAAAPAAQPAQQPIPGMQQQPAAAPMAGFVSSHQQLQQQHQQPASYGGRGGNMPYGGTSAGAQTQQGPPAAIFPIKSLNPYQNKWTIKARVINKSDVRTWNKNGREGRLFSFTLADESGEIRVTGFNDSVNLFYERLQEGQVYLVSKASIKAANRMFNNTGNDYEMTIETGTVIELCEDSGSVPQMKLNTLELARLMEVEKDANVDVIAVVRECGPIGEIVTKAGKSLKKRELIIVDESGFSVRLTLWGRQAETFEHSDNPVICIKGARVGDFGGRSLSVSMGSTLSVNPPMNEAYRLRGWYDSKGSSMDFRTFSGGAGSSSSGSSRGEIKTISQIRDENLGMGEKASCICAFPDYVRIRASIAFLRKENLWYPACPNEACKNKKVVEMGSEWRCERCNNSYPRPNYRYIMSLSVTDYTGQTWLQAFNETAEKLIGKTANEMNELREQNEAAFNAIIEEALFKQYTMVVRAKAENYQDENKVRLSLQELIPIDHVSASREMIETITAILGRI